MFLNNNKKKVRKRINQFILCKDVRNSNNYTTRLFITVGPIIIKRNHEGNKTKISGSY